MTPDTAVEPLNLLLVEDNDAHAEMVKRSFAQHKLMNRIFHVDDGQKALDYVFREGEYSDVEKFPSQH
jgi:CheY-like chemotaxis protein